MIDQKTKHSAHILRRLVLLYYKTVMEEQCLENTRTIDGDATSPMASRASIDRSIWPALLFGSHLERVGAMNTKYLGPSSEHPARMIAIDVPAKREATGATHSQIA